MSVADDEAKRWVQTVLPRLQRMHEGLERHYHNWEHIKECLAQHTAARSAFHNEWAGAFAILFHDCVYDPRRNDNEERSGETAQQVLGELRVPDDFIAEVVRLILWTKHEREPAAEDIDARLVIDVDLAILGAPRERFDRYEADVRKEYAHVSDDDFRAGRAAVLRRFLARPSVYLTDFFRGRYEAAARANLERSLARLESVP